MIAPRQDSPGSRRVRQCLATIGRWRLFAKLSELSIALQKSVWQTRAWTFQEGVLSRRCLFFSGDQVYFQCQSGYYTEDSHGKQSRSQWNSGFANPFKQKVAKNTESFYQTFNIYNNLVKAYSSRQHTYHPDSLNAFRGILSSFSASYGWDFINALPENVFDLALLWRPMLTADLRPRQSSYLSRDLSCRTSTWCWSSWVGNIYRDSWRMDSYAGHKISLQPAVGQFVVASPDCLRTICKWKTDTNNEDTEGVLKDARGYIDEHKSSWNESDGEMKNPWNMVLIFKAFATDLSRTSIQFGTSHHTTHQKMSSWMKWACRKNAWILDGDGRHCGTLYGLHSTWTNLHNPRLCEFILLSSFSQKEVKPEDINAHRGSLPLDYPSSDDYYSEIFDTSHYKYTNCWAHNIMLIKWEGNLAIRVAIGQIHVDAWAALRCSTKMIALV